MELLALLPSANHTEWASKVAQQSRIRLPMHETQVRSLGWEDLLENEMVTHSIFLPGKFHQQRSLAGSSPLGHKRVIHNLATKQQ